ncbi:uncharacterized protein LOC116433646 [Nomia melanderi]|uniref:uncharacterized protein LOC116433646 n=1 Tax=Nomia melanderi TaxID=2448451 RepID=UPI003FCDE47C
MTLNCGKEEFSQYVISFRKIILMGLKGLYQGQLIHHRTRSLTSNNEYFVVNNKEIACIFLLLQANIQCTNRIIMHPKLIKIYRPLQIYNMRTVSQIIAKSCPFITLVYSLIVVVLTTFINGRITPVFVFFCIQVYLNWYSVYNISRKVTTMEVRTIGKKTIHNKVANTIEYRWYCEKCIKYTYKPTQHCIFCRKCFHFRDHHCSFLGACILRQNIGNFILFCFYASLTCIYSLCTLGPYLYENINRLIRTDTDSFNIFLNFCVPIALIKLLYSKENSYILLITMFDILVSILCICLVYATWKLHSCMNGKQRYSNISGKQNLKEIFGSYGFSNIIFPYNGLIGIRDLNGKYELKQV